MAEDTDKSLKTEEPTLKRLEEAYSRGRFAQSPEVGVVFVLTASFTVLLFTARQRSEELGTLARGIFGHLGEFSITRESASHWLGEGLVSMLYLAFPLFAACLLAGVLAGGLQSGFRLTPKVLEVKFERLNPAAGLKKLIDPQSLVRFGVDFLKFLAVGLILSGFIREIMHDPIFYSPVSIEYIGQFILKATLMLLVRLILAIGVIAAIHYSYQRYKTKRELMMSRQEVKDERKEQEGDPLVKSRQRAIAMRLLRKQMLDAVPTADVVVTNPTHYAVALKYEKGEDPAPVVLAKGEHLFAGRIKDIAVKHGVPMVENKPIARLLVRIGRVGEPIPYQLYQVIAEILSHVYRTHRYYFHRLKARRMLEA